MESYKAWVRRNRLWISSFENLVNALRGLLFYLALRCRQSFDVNGGQFDLNESDGWFSCQTMTWFLPERLSNSELMPEAVSTLLGLVTVMNQHIIETDPRPPFHGVNQQMPEPSISPDDSVPWSLLVSVTKEVEVLTEMAAEHYLGTERKWGPVVSLETIKAIIRLIILHKSGYKMLLDGGESKNEGGCAVGESERQIVPTERAFSWSQQQQLQRANRDRQFGAPNSRDLRGRATQAMHRFNEQVAGPSQPSWIRQQQLIQQARAHETIMYDPGPVSLARKAESCVSSAFVTGEVLLIARPLFYALLVWRYGLKSWKPWLAALSVDLTGTYLVSRATSSQQPYGTTETSHQGLSPTLSAEESLELRRRKLRWALYVMRDPFFSRYTRRQVEAAEQLLAPVPALGTLAAKAVDLLLGVQQLYTYTAAS